MVFERLPFRTRIVFIIERGELLQDPEGFKDLMSQGLAMGLTGCFQSGTWPAVTVLEQPVHFTDAGNQLSVLALQHLYVSESYEKY